MAGLTDEGKETTINVSQPNGMGYGPWGWGNGWGGGYNPYGFFDNRAPATGVVGTVLGGVALLGLLGAGAGMLGNRNGYFGGNGQPCPAPINMRDLENERLLSAKDAEIGKLQAQIYTDQQVNELRKELQSATAAQAVINAQTGGAIGILQSQAAQVASMQMNVLKPVVIKASEAVATAALPAPASSGSGS